MSHSFNAGPVSYARIEAPPAEPQVEITFWEDLAERCVRTFIAVFLTTIGAAATTVVDLSSIKVVAVAGLASAGTAVLGCVTRAFGTTDTASVL